MLKRFFLLKTRGHNVLLVARVVTVITGERAGGSSRPFEKWSLPNTMQGRDTVSALEATIRWLLYFYLPVVMT